MTHIYLALLTFILFLFNNAAIAHAQNEGLLTELSTEYAYGQELRFSLQVENASDVEQMTLYFRPELSTNIYAVEVTFQQGDTISVTQAIDANALDIRPYAEVTYSWEIRTPDGVQQTPERSFTYEDDRFPWQTLVRDTVTAHWTGELPPFGDNVLDTVDNSLNHLAEIIPLEKIDPIDVYVYPNTADLRAALQLGGIADDQTNQLDLGVILVTAVNSKTADSDLKQSIPYELANLLLYRAAGDQYSSVPWWLREGIAGAARPNNNPRHEQLLFDAVKFGETIPLKRLCVLPQESGDRQELAAVQAASLVRFLSESQSTGTIPDLLSTYIQGNDCEQGVNRVLGISLDDLDSDWLADLQEPSSVQSLVSDVAIWIILLIAGTLLMLVLIRATRKKEQ